MLSMPVAIFRCTNLDFKNDQTCSLIVIKLEWVVTKNVFKQFSNLNIFIIITQKRSYQFYKNIFSQY